MDGSVPGNPLVQPPPLDAPHAPSGVLPFDTPALAQRHRGTDPQSRHQGAVHHALAHPHQTAAARNRQPGGRHHTTTMAHTVRSHARQQPRFGAAKVEMGLLTAVNTGTNQAYVRLYGSQADVIGPLPLGRGLASVAAAGQTAMVMLLDESNPTDAMIVAVY